MFTDAVVVFGGGIILSMGRTFRDACAWAMCLAWSQCGQ